jgi:hypothetical protein
MRHWLEGRQVLAMHRQTGGFLSLAIPTCRCYLASGTMQGALVW